MSNLPMPVYLIVVPALFLLGYTAHTDYTYGFFTPTAYLLPIALLGAALWLYRHFQKMGAYLRHPVVISEAELLQVAQSFVRVHPCHTWTDEQGMIHHYHQSDDGTIRLHPLGNFGGCYQLDLQRRPSAVRVRCTIPHERNSNPPLYPFKRHRFLGTIHQLLQAATGNQGIEAVGKTLADEALHREMTAGLWQSGRGWRYLITAIMATFFIGIGSSMLYYEDHFIAYAFVFVPIVLLVIYIRSELKAAARRRVR